VIDVTNIGDLCDQPNIRYFQSADTDLRFTSMEQLMADGIANGHTYFHLTLEMFVSSYHFSLSLLFPLLFLALLSLVISCSSSSSSSSSVTPTPAAIPVATRAAAVFSSCIAVLFLQLVLVLRCVSVFGGLCVPPPLSPSRWEGLVVKHEHAHTHLRCVFCRHTHRFCRRPCHRSAWHHTRPQLPEKKKGTKFGRTASKIFKAFSSKSSKPKSLTTVPASPLTPTPMPLPSVGSGSPFSPAGPVPPANSSGSRSASAPAVAASPPPAGADDEGAAEALYRPLYAELEPDEGASVS
jgi:hypothetical protein